MKISYNWLKTLANIDIDESEAGALLTASGLEVEAIEKFESISGGLKGLVVGHILECGKHPDADKLSLTKVDIGNNTILDIVCGAPNVAANQKVIVATVGTKLFPISGEPFEIKKSKIRGAISEGMICAEDEIGIGASHAGIIILPNEIEKGTLASDYYKIENDFIFEIGLTPNRCDATSHLGVARDLVAILNCTKSTSHYKLNVPQEISLGEWSNINKIEIQIDNNEACPRYSGLVISGVEIKESPKWLQNRLKSINLRPINNIVDITNYVMHHLGQPLHAFDAEKIEGKRIIVRNAKENETITTLDGINRKLKISDLLICDAVKPLCIAGLFGGVESGVTEKTTSIFLESAYFNPDAVRASSKNHGLKTDASFRFERGTDPEMPVIALTQAAQLILEMPGGNLSMSVIDNYVHKLEPNKVAFSFQNCFDLIGKEIDNALVKKIISQLGIEIITEGNDGLLLAVPRYKADVTREVDVIEEVMRIYGYNNVEASKQFSFAKSNSVRNFSQDLEGKISSLLINSGFNEMMNLSLSREENFDNKNLVKVVNPLSKELNVLRANLLHGGLETMAYNLNRNNLNLKLFEFGKSYQIKDSEDLAYQETKQLSLFICGDFFKENPFQLKQKNNFSVLNSMVDAILIKAGISNIKKIESTNTDFEFGLEFHLNNKLICELGLVKKNILKKIEIKEEVYFATFNWDTMLKPYSKQKIEYQELNKFPSVRRDLALLLDDTINYQELLEASYSAERKLLKEVNLFDIFKNEKLGNKKSYALSFIFSDSEKTLTDKQIEGTMEKLINTFKQKFNAEIR